MRFKRLVEGKANNVLRKKTPNGLRYPRWGGGRRSRPTGKMIRRRKLLEICAESPASGARFVGWRAVVQDSL